MTIPPSTGVPDDAMDRAPSPTPLAGQQWPHPGPVPALPVATSGGTRRTRAIVLVGGAVLAAAVVLAVALTLRGASGPATPREAVQAFIDAGNAEDFGASWDMLCRRDQLTLGPRPHYLQERAAAAEETAALRAGTQVTVGDVQYDGTVPGYAVDLLIAPGDGSPPVQMVVVEEEGAFRICGVR